jgi:hypothetical protein
MDHPTWSGSLEASHKPWAIQVEHAKELEHPGIETRSIQQIDE